MTYFPHFTLCSQKLLVDFCRHNKIQYTAEASLVRDVMTTESKTGFCWKGPYRSSSCNHPDIGWDTFHQTRLLRTPTSLTLNLPKSGASTAYLGNLCQCLTTLRVKNLFLLSDPSLPSVQLKAIPPCPCENSPSKLIVSPVQVLKGDVRFLWSFLQAEKPQLSAYLHRSGVLVL